MNLLRTAFACLILLAACVVGSSSGADHPKDVVWPLRFCGDGELYDPAPEDVCCFHDPPIDQDSVDVHVERSGGPIAILLDSTHPGTKLKVRLVTEMDRVVWERSVRSDTMGRCSLRKLDWRGSSKNHLNERRYYFVVEGTEECLALVIEVAP